MLNGKFIKRALQLFIRFLKEEKIIMHMMDMKLHIQIMAVIFLHLQEKKQDTLKEFGLDDQEPIKMEVELFTWEKLDLKELFSQHLFGK